MEPTGQRRFNWVRGDLHQIVRSSTGVRLNERGVQVIRSPSTVTVEWKTLPCLPDPSSLCTTEDGGRFFPIDSVNVSGNASAVAGGMRSIAEVGCSSTAAKRTLVFPSSRYDVSVCDVVDGRLDVFWDGETLHYRRLRTPTWLYMLVGAACVYLVSCVAQNLTALLVNPNEAKPGVGTGLGVGPGP
eukprot:765814-Hanusia_phi.AAC.7